MALLEIFLPKAGSNPLHIKSAQKVHSECSSFNAVEYAISRDLWTRLLLGKNRLFNDWIMQEMVPHSLGGTTLLHKSVLPFTMIFSMIGFLEKSY